MPLTKSSNISPRWIPGAVLVLLIIFLTIQNVGISPTRDFTPSHNTIAKSTASTESSQGIVSDETHSSFTNPSARMHPHTSYPIAPLYCPTTPGVNFQRILKVKLDIDHPLSAHLQFLTDRLSKYRLSPQNVHVAKDGSTAYELSGVNDKLLDVILTDPGVWTVECLKEISLSPSGELRAQR
ncbi:hypothetical protein HYALB_00003431 [Hymenoscyphus albidus]|uniref:Uncharacterized protein n=1 Tax=Hymenoscyphus albidus TaxID=595503 RepID=A0A9N9LDW4_9HELO|nr:hypothetical protein HYALB_00003431 [Hymenoscyphus albidus]